VAYPGTRYKSADARLRRLRSRRRYDLNDRHKYRAAAPCPRGLILVTQLADEMEPNKGGSWHPVKTGKQTLNS
jgi:hypothetical protein